MNMRPVEIDKVDRAIAEKELEELRHKYVEQFNYIRDTFGCHNELLELEEIASELSVLEAQLQS